MPFSRSRNGFEIETDTGEKKTAYAEVFPVEITNQASTVRVTLYQGINRQIRKMFEAVGTNVDFLKRVKIGELSVSGLNRGEVRKLTPSEINYLLNI